MANINSYTDEFKTQIVALYQNGKSVSCLFKEYNITRELLINESSNLLIQEVLKLKIIVLLKKMN